MSGKLNTRMSRWKLGDAPDVYLEGEQYPDVIRFLREMCAMMEDRHNVATTKNTRRNYRYSPNLLPKMDGMEKPVESEKTPKKIFRFFFVL